MGKAAGPGDGAGREDSAAALNLMVDSVAGQYSTTLTERLDQWKTYTRALKLF